MFVYAVRLHLHPICEHKRTSAFEEIIAIALIRVLNSLLFTLLNDNNIFTRDHM